MNILPTQTSTCLQFTNCGYEIHDAITTIITSILHGDATNACKIAADVVYTSHAFTQILIYALHWTYIMFYSPLNPDLLIFITSNIGENAGDINLTAIYMPDNNMSTSSVTMLNICNVIDNMALRCANCDILLLTHISETMEIDIDEYANTTSLSQDDISTLKKIQSDNDNIYQPNGMFKTAAITRAKKVIEKCANNNMLFILAAIIGECSGIYRITMVYTIIVECAFKNYPLLMNGISLHYMIEQFKNRPTETMQTCAIIYMVVLYTYINKITDNMQENIFTTITQPQIDVIYAAQINNNVPIDAYGINGIFKIPHTFENHTHLLHTWRAAGDMQNINALNGLKNNKDLNAHTLFRCPTKNVTWDEFYKSFYNAQQNIHKGHNHTKLKGSRPYNTILSMVNVPNIYTDEIDKVPISIFNN